MVTFLHRSDEGTFLNLQYLPKWGLKNERSLAYVRTPRLSEFHPFSGADTAIAAYAFDGTVCLQARRRWGAHGPRLLEASRGTDVLDARHRRERRGPWAVAGKRWPRALPSEVTQRSPQRAAEQHAVCPGSALSQSPPPSQSGRSWLALCLRDCAAAAGRCAECCRPPSALSATRALRAASVVSSSSSDASASQARRCPDNADGAEATVR